MIIYHSDDFRYRFLSNYVCEKNELLLYLYYLLAI